MKIDEKWIHAGCPVIHVDDPSIRSDNITDYLLLIERAKEFHGVDSCFALLADYAFGKDGPDRYAHTTDARPELNPRFYQNTIVVDHHATVRPLKKPDAFGFSERVIGPSGEEMKI